MSLLVGIFAFAQKYIESYNSLRSNKNYTETIKYMDKAVERIETIYIYIRHPITCIMNMEKLLLNEVMAIDQIVYKPTWKKRN